MKRAIALSLFALFLVACGNKGPLVLPIDANLPANTIIK
ncbi:LPS translocon maturation chaperone LptM [Reinekea sp.]